MKFFLTNGSNFAIGRDLRISTFFEDISFYRWIEKIEFCFLFFFFFNIFPFIADQIRSDPILEIRTIMEPRTCGPLDHPYVEGTKRGGEGTGAVRTTLPLMENIVINHESTSIPYYRPVNLFPIALEEPIYRSQNEEIPRLRGAARYTRVRHRARLGQPTKSSRNKRGDYIID